MTTETSHRRDLTKARFLDAVEKLCESQSPSNVTMREVAEEAGASVGLAYHHFDSKLDLFGSALDRMAASMTKQAFLDPNPRAIVPALIESLSARPAFPRMIAWLVLNGESPTVAMGGHPVVAHAAQRAAADGHPDPMTVGALLALFGLAASFFGATVNVAVQREPADDRLIDALAEAFVLEASRGVPARSPDRASGSRRGDT